MISNWVRREQLRQNGMKGVHCKGEQNTAERDPASTHSIEAKGVVKVPGTPNDSFFSKLWFDYDCEV